MTQSPPKRKTSWSTIIVIVGLTPCVLGTCLAVALNSKDKKTAPSEPSAATKGPADSSAPETNAQRQAKIDEFTKSISQMQRKAKLQVITAVQLHGSGWAYVTVNNNWFAVQRGIRLQFAQNLWKMWAGIDSPKQPDAAHIRILDENGNDLAHSGLVFGSSVELSDDQ